jgi:hypothetical protein
MCDDEVRRINDSVASQDSAPRQVAILRLPEHWVKSAKLPERRSLEPAISAIQVINFIVAVGNARQIHLMTIVESQSTQASQNRVPRLLNDAPRDSNFATR